MFNLIDTIKSILFETLDQAHMNDNAIKLKFMHFTMMKREFSINSTGNGGTLTPPYGMMTIACTEGRL